MCGGSDADVHPRARSAYGESASIHQVTGFGSLVRIAIQMCGFAHTARTTSPEIATGLLKSQSPA